MGRRLGQVMTHLVVQYGPDMEETFNAIQNVIAREALGEKGIQVRLLARGQLALVQCMGDMKGAPRSTQRRRHYRHRTGSWPGQGHRAENGACCRCVDPARRRGPAAREKPLCAARQHGRGAAQHTSGERIARTDGWDGRDGWWAGGPKTLCVQRRLYKDPEPAMGPGCRRRILFRAPRPRGTPRAWRFHSGGSAASIDLLT